MQRYANFNSVAGFYDKLCNLVFGQQIRKSQIDALHFIPANSVILIIGGGTGWILEEIVKIHSSGLRITYIDNSSKMINLSKKRNVGSNTIEFKLESIGTAELQGENFDVVITPFLLDAFSQQNVEIVFKKLSKSLKTNGLWFYTDFYLHKNSKRWQVITIKVMYAFFRLTCRLEANKLPMVGPLFSNYKIISRNTYCKNFVVAEVFRK